MEDLSKMYTLIENKEKICENVSLKDLKKVIKKLNLSENSPQKKIKKELFEEVLFNDAMIVFDTFTFIDKLPVFLIGRYQRNELTGEKMEIFFDEEEDKAYLYRTISKNDEYEFDEEYFQALKRVDVILKDDNTPFPNGLFPNIRADRKDLIKWYGMTDEMGGEILFVSKNRNNKLEIEFEGCDTPE